LKDSLAVSIEALSWIELRGYGLQLALSSALSQLGITDKRVAREARLLATETLRRKNLIDRIVERAIAPTRLESLKLGVRNFLRVYTLQTKLRGGENEARTIAEWGRSVLGWRDLAPVEEAMGTIPMVQIEELLGGISEDERVGLQTYHPLWYVKYCIKLLGRGEALRLLERNAKPPPSYIRVNTLKARDIDLLEELSTNRVKLSKVDGIDHVYRVEVAKTQLASLLAHTRGEFTLQDLSSSLVVEVLDPKPGEVVFDLCAAPGVKSTVIAQKMRNEGSIYSIDYSGSRMRSMKTFLRRLGVTNAEAIIADARRFLPLNLQADRVLLDPPCSGTGIFWREPAMKWSTTESTVRRLSRLQSALIESAAENVKTGGVLVYSTCSITIEENENVVERLLKSRLGFELADATPRLGSAGLKGLKECQRLYPHSDEANGCFIAKLVRSR